MAAVAAVRTVHRRAVLGRNRDGARADSAWLNLLPSAAVVNLLTQTTYGEATVNHGQRWDALMGSVAMMLPAPLFKA